MGVSGLNPLTAAETLAAITNDATKWDGANLDSLLSAIQTDTTAIIAAIIKAPVFNWNAHDKYTDISGTWVSAPATTAHLGQNLLEDTNNINVQVALGKAFYVPTSGDYTCILIGRRDTNRGKAHIMINGVDKGNVDYYGTALDNHILSVSLGTLAAGLKCICLLVSDKNGGSAGYKMDLNAVIIVKT